MLVAELLSERVEFFFNGRVWPLLFTHRALLLCQRETGIDTLNAANLGDPSASLLRGLLYGALAAAGADCSVADVGRCFAPRAIPTIRRCVIAAWIASMAEPDPKKREINKDAKPRPAPTWMESWAEATSRHGLGLSDERWLDMTPRQVGFLQKKRLEQKQREELLVGIIASTVENFSACHPKKPVSAEAFMLHGFEREEEEPAAPGDQLMAIMGGLAKAANSSGFIDAANKHGEKGK